jgi:hypothetical protein
MMGFASLYPSYDAVIPGGRDSIEPGIDFAAHACRRMDTGVALDRLLLNLRDVGAD